MLVVCHLDGVSQTFQSWGLSKFQKFCKPWHR